MINLTQEFVFETDSLKSLMTVLGAIVPVTLGKNGQYTHLQIIKDQPSSYSDGRYDSYYWDRQNPIVQTKNPEEFLLIEPSRTYNGVTFNQVLETFKDQDSASRRSNQLFSMLPKARPRRKWIMTLADYPKDNERAKNRIKCASHQQMLQKVEEMLSFGTLENLKTELFRDCENIYADLDGSSHSGFRVQHRPNGGFNELDISLVFIYYGK